MIRQIKDRQYALRFEGKPGEKLEYVERILAVGIDYHKDDTDKKHECKVEVLRDRQASFRLRAILSFWQVADEVSGMIYCTRRCVVAA